MVVKQLKELIIEGSTYCICKSQSQSSVFQPSENLHFDNVSAGPTMEGPWQILDAK